MGKRPAPSLEDAAALNPPGWSDKEYAAPDLSSAGRDKHVDVKAFEARAFAIVQSQLAPTAQTGFFMYMMVPNQINLFAMMFMTSMGAGPFKNLFSVGQAFAPVTAPGVNLALPKLGFIMLNLVGVGIVAWKLRAMGLLPVTSADWVSLLPARHAAEFSAGALEVG